MLRRNQAPQFGANFGFLSTSAQGVQPEKRHSRNIAIKSQRRIPGIQKITSRNQTIECWND
jgi:hypothetical protein